jgi:RNA polymerase sigma-70 factor (ECF subfamily)
VSGERSDEVTSPGASEETSQGERFRSIFEHRYPSIHSYVLRRLGATSNDVADVTSQIFAVAWRRRAQIPEPPDDLPWLYGVARKIVSRHWRSGQRRQHLTDRLESEAKTHPEASTSPDPETVLVREAVSRLRTKDQELVRLILWEELSHAEAGKVLGCSANAVAVRLHKAREKLRSQLGKESMRRNRGPSAANGHDQEGPTDES